MLGRLIRIIAVNIAILVFGLLAIEALFGTWFSNDPLDRLNIARSSAAQVDATGLYPDGREFTYRRDSWGFRGNGIDPAAIDILTVGGSTTNQLYLPDELTWQAVAAARLAERGKPVGIANSGIDGQSTVGHLFNFETWYPAIPGLKPRIVLAYVGINDAMIGVNSTDTLAFSSIFKWFRHNSALFRLGRTVTGMLEARRTNLTHSALDFARAQWTDTPNTATNREARPVADPAAYAERLRRMAGRIGAMGAKAVFVTQTRGDYKVVDGKVWGLIRDDELNGVDNWRLLDEFNRVTLAVCAEGHAVCLDLAAELAFADGDFYDHVHNTPAGAARIGAWLAARLEPLL
ncbi:SGNH/GDSL hydrolase family protein [Magnetospirillum sp. SS-4]|uniref:SGNH/GDSL hydrolase family protein n=1 Tax=Magnetospirillum sp. SS-4 TaxID=2681465 RepID=UPI00137DF331|nr:SGNH/GDSL hydrolase family protein [Magnetospirillum sp. SS-4]CAA7612481.1 putative lysophospholipase L1 and related esterases [Magnetospirillum sp. SS-4]